ncbi:ECF transporter S component [Periweissella cryptocerci]|uniref:ECF transporter S component n=1 Tax=Periweissella cryptocerci TaxID=2506420 RepID=A0A4P6YTB8_9LACO|nr:ECF transporter S component [Periweissella cryptocerci]QBO35931.1 ECF transporter S component [Periweissella cryptocerci]
MAKPTNMRTLVLTAVFLAILIIQVFVFPILGYLPLGAFVVGASVTIIQFTIAIGTIVIGTKQGMILGAFWGIFRLIQAWTTQGTLGSYMFMNPFTSIVPSIMVAVVVGLIARKAISSNKTSGRVGGFALAGALAAFTNTFFVTVFTWIGFNVMHFNGGTSGFKITTLGADFLPWFLSVIVGFNGIFEIIAGIIIVPLITVPVLKALKR